MKENLARELEWNYCYLFIYLGPKIQERKTSIQREENDRARNEPT